MHALRDWLLVHPEQALAVAKLTADPALANALTSRIIHAIELSASNPESQAALAEIIKHPAEYPEGVLMQAVVAAGAVGEIKSPQLASALATMAAAPNPSDDFLVNDAALYALGNLSNENPALRQTLGSTLEAQLTSDTPGASRDTEVALNALANGRIASPTLLTKAATLAQNSPDEAVRIAALHYLGRTSSADLNLLQHALNDASESVRMEAISVLADPETATPDGIATALKLLYKPNLSDALTGHLITSIAPLQEQFPSISPALQQARQGTSRQNTLAQLNDALGL